MMQAGPLWVNHTVGKIRIPFYKYKNINIMAKFKIFSKAIELKGISSQQETF